MSTVNSVDVPLSGSTGTGNFVGTTSPTLVTPTIGAATATSVGFSPTTGGIVGTTTNDNTDAGNVGESIVSAVDTPGISLTNNTAADITSISLTAGDWDVWGNVVLIFGATTNCTTYGMWSSATSATVPDVTLSCNISTSVAGIVPGAITGCGNSIPPLRYSLSGTTTIYLSVKAAFSISTLAAFGVIQARRAR